MYFTLGPSDDHLPEALPPRQNPLVRAGPLAQDSGEPGSIRKPQTVAEYYSGLRDDMFSSCLPLIMPLFVALTFIAFMAAFFTAAPLLAQDQKCEGTAALASQTFDIAGRLRFAYGHAILIILCGLLSVTSLAMTFKIFKIHRAVGTTVRNVWIDKLLWAIFVCMVPGALIWTGVALWASPVIDLAFRPFFTGIAEHGCDKDASAFQADLRLNAIFGGSFVLLTVSSVASSLCTLSWRYETNDINGRWSNSYVLREKLNMLLTLFVLSSALLVAGNLSLGSLLNWSMDIAGAYKGPPGTNASGLADIDALRSFAKAIAGFSGAMASCVLLAMFVPAFSTLFDEIEIAARTHAAYDKTAGMKPVVVLDLLAQLGTPAIRYSGTAAQQPEERPAPPYFVAGFEAAAAWKKKHGLALSMADISTGLIAVAAPLLSSSAIDLSKALIGGH